jgi:hypothetical protein
MKVKIIKKQHKYEKNEKNKIKIISVKIAIKKLKGNNKL